MMFDAVCVNAHCVERGVPKATDDAYRPDVEDRRAVCGECGEPLEVAP